MEPSQSVEDEGSSDIDFFAEMEVLPKLGPLHAFHLFSETNEEPAFLIAKRLGNYDEIDWIGSANRLQGRPAIAAFGSSAALAFMRRGFVPVANWRTTPNWKNLGFHNPPISNHFHRVTR